MNSIIFNLLPIILPAIAFYLYSRLRYARIKQLAHLPRPPPSLVWGHLKLLGHILNKDPSRHFEYGFFDLFKQTPNQSGFLVLDIRPGFPPMAIVQSHNLAEQISRASTKYKYSVPKSPTADVIAPVVGRRSMILYNEEPWKNAQKRFLAAFAPSNLGTFLPQIIEKTKIFLNVLDEYAQLRKEFTLGERCTLLTFDIIGCAVLNTDLKSQGHSSDQHQLVRDFRDLLAAMPGAFAARAWFIRPINHYKRGVIIKRIETLLQSIIQKKLEEQREKGRDGIDRSVLALGLESSPILTPEVMQEYIDSVRTFLFAGHDTTSVILQWAFYELSRTPHAMAALRQELDEVLGPDPDPTATAAAILSGDGKLSKLQYLSAVLKETLRLHPPAGTARMAPPGSDFHLETENGPVCVDGIILYISHYSLHRDPAVYGESANAWVPERWLQGGSHDDPKVPNSAWRPFERGPRSCIGQELANLEARVVLAMAVRRYDFTKVGLGASALGGDGKPIQDEYGQYEVTSPLYDTFNLSAKPVDGMKMTIKLH